jgi:ferrous iron transport protein B
MIEKIFLIGNPNVGKSVVFSRLTGVDVIVSNYPGTTVEFAKNYLKIGEQKLEVIDLPGVYSLEPSSKAEEVTVSLLSSEPKDRIAVINIIDATNLERNLYLSLQLIEEGYPVIICLNMCDDMKHRGINIDVTRLEELLGTPVISACAVTGMGIKLLIENLKRAKQRPPQSRSHKERWQEIGQIVETVQHLSHRHHTLREIMEDASVRPLPGLFMAAGILYVSFILVRSLAETLIARITDPVFAELYHPWCIK